jgi:hypothetical protein
VNGIRKALLGGGLAVAALAGGALGASLLGTAQAQSSSTTTPPAAGAQPDAPRGAPDPDPTRGGHVANGITETVLTGDTAEKAKAAALAAVPGGTVQRVENDAEGAVYEAHMLKPDGTPVTVKMDGNFKVTGIESGGPGGHGRGMWDHGTGPNDPATSTPPSTRPS